MKKLIKIILIAFLFVSCHSTKKLTETKQSNDQTFKSSQVEDKKTEIQKNNDLKVDQEIVIETEEYYPPDITTGEITPGTNNPEPKQGAIKSRTRKTIKAKTEDKGKTITNEESSKKGDVESNNKSTTETKATESPAPDPKRFRYIFGILLILLIGGFIIYKKWQSIKPKIKLIFRSFFG